MPSAIPSSRGPSNRVGGGGGGGLCPTGAIRGGGGGDDAYPINNGAGSNNFLRASDDRYGGAVGGGGPRHDLEDDDLAMLRSANVSPINRYHRHHHEVYWNQGQSVDTRVVNEKHRKQRVEEVEREGSLLPGVS